MAEFEGLAITQSLPGVIFSTSSVRAHLPAYADSQPARRSALRRVSVAWGHKNRHADSRQRQGMLGVRACLFRTATVSICRLPVFVMSDLDLRYEQLDVEEPFPSSRQAAGSRQDFERRRPHQAWWIRSLQGCGWRWHRPATTAGPNPPLRTTSPVPAGLSEKAQYTEEAADGYFNSMERLSKFETARSLVPRPESAAADWQIERDRFDCLPARPDFHDRRESRSTRTRNTTSDTDYLQLPTLSVCARGA